MKRVNMALRRLIFCVLLLVLCSCSKVVHWVKDTLPQQESVVTSCLLTKKYHKSITLYDQFTTVAKFDVLWLADDIRILYADTFSRRSGKGEDQKKALLRRQLEENNHFISFYVLSLYECPLGDAQNVWTIMLRVNDKNYTPIEIKVVELLPEYICMFDKRYDRFKVAYSVKFDAKDIEGNPIITDRSDTVELIFRTATKNIGATWIL